MHRRTNERRDGRWTDLGTKLIYPFSKEKNGYNNNNTRASVDGTPSQIPAFFTYNLYLGVKVTQNVAQYLLHNVTYAPVKFEVDISNG